MTVDLVAVTSGVDVWRSQVRDRVNDVHAWLGLGCAYEAAGLLDEALMALRRAVVLSDGSSESLERLGCALCRAGRGSEAVDSLEASVRNGGGSSARLNLGVALLMEGRYSDAARELRVVVEEAPEDGLAWSKLGVAQYRLGRYVESLEAFCASSTADQGAVVEGSEEACAWLGALAAAAQ